MPNITGTDQFGKIISDTGVNVANANITSAAKALEIWNGFIAGWLTLKADAGFMTNSPADFNEGVLLTQIFKEIMALGAAKVKAHVSARTSTESAEVRRLLISLSAQYAGTFGGAFGADYGTIDTRGVIAEAGIEVEAENLTLGAMAFSETGNIIDGSVLNDNQKLLAVSLLTAVLNKYLGLNANTGITSLLPEPVVTAVNASG